MRSLILLTFVAIASANVVSYRDVIEQEWESFKQEHGKTYADQTEERLRMKIFMENKHKIAKHNMRASNGLKTYHLAMNKYGDLLHHEFVKMMNGFKMNTPRAINGSTFLAPMNFDPPKNIDWRQLGYVSKVKDQGQCGSCWSFSTTGALEGQHYRKTGKMIELSEQNLIDCSTRYGNSGCEGGLMDNAFTYIKENRGIDTEEAYPYEGKDKKCRFSKRTIGADDTGFVDIPAGSEVHLQHAIGSIGPVSVAIDASHESFQFYHNGVYDEAECSSEELDHGVLAVGYGEEKGQEYWLIKNSWGTTWGDKGYIKMARNKNNQCGIASSASYPLV